MEIPFFNGRRTYAEFRPAMERALARVIQSGQAILGDELRRFEAAFADYCDVRHAVGVGNGLDALSLVLRALDIDASSEVIVPGHTFIATWLAVSQTGARIVPVDIDLASFTINPVVVADAITPKTKAVVAVHLYGQSADMRALSDIVRGRDIAVIEDAAQSHGATYGGRRAGGLGTAAAFSFYPTKNLGALGDGGAVTTDDHALADRIRLLRNYGSGQKYYHQELGVNSRLDEFQAAVLDAKLPTLDAKNERRREVAARYSEGLGGVPNLVVPATAADRDHVWHLYVLRSTARDAVRAQLAREGIETLIHYPIPPHRQAAYAGTSMANAQLPQTELAAAQVFSLPLWPEMTDDEVDYVIARTRRAALEAAGPSPQLAPQPAA